MDRINNTDANTFAWVFLAIYFWDKDLVTLEEIMHSADVINQAVPSDSDLQRAILFLTRHGLIKNLDRSFATTDTGRAIFKSVDKGSSNIFEICSALEPHFASLGAA